LDTFIPIIEKGFVLCRNKENQFKLNLSFTLKSSKAVIEVIPDSTLILYGKGMSYQLVVL
jgi:hypothetical protein